VKRDEELRKLVLETLDQPILVLSQDLRRVLWKNRAAARVVPGTSPPLTAAAGAYVAARSDGEKPSPVRLRLGERAFYLRVLTADAEPPVEVVLLAEEVLRDVDAYKLLHAKNGVSRREYQVLTALRLGKTNRQIALELGLAEGTVNVHVHHLLARFDAPNRTRLVRVVEEILASDTQLSRPVGR
jgi:DNA-binding CsgD family transcriptional regulator